MVAVVRKAVDLTVTLTRQSTVKAVGNPNTQPHAFPLSNFDRIVSGFPILLFYAYPRPPTAGGFPSVVRSLTTSLSAALARFPAFAGTIVRGPRPSDSELLCNNEGARLIEASATVPLAELDFYNHNKSIRRVFLPENVGHASPLSVQVTGFACGGFSVSWTYDHLLSDAYGFIKFLSAWCDLARTKKLSPAAAALDYDRRRTIFRPRSPLVRSRLVDEIFTTCTEEEIRCNVPARATERYLYYVKGSTLERLRMLASKDGPRRSRTEALSAYLWKLMGKSVADDNKSVSMCKMGWAVDGRRTFDSPTMSDYIGNVVTMAVGEGSIEELKRASLARVAENVARSISGVANRGHFLDFNDWIEERRRSSDGRVMLPSIVVGHDVPAVIVSSCYKMPVMPMDFGLGLPAVGMFMSAPDRMGTGNVRIVSSGRGDGSWLVSALIWPELAATLESDPARVFEPVTAAHLGL